MGAYPSLARFAQPTLDQLGAARLEAWAAELGDLALGQAILGNKRLEGRILKDILGGAKVDVASVEASDDASVIEVLMTRGAVALATTLGMVWHRPTVMEWITWGRFGLMLPGVDLSEARLAVSAVAQDSRVKAGAPDVAYADIPASHLREDGDLLLSCWVGALPAELRERLVLFAQLEAGPADDRFSALVRETAQAMLGEAG